MYDPTSQTRDVGHPWVCGWLRRTGNGKCNSRSLRDDKQKEQATAKRTSNSKKNKQRQKEQATAKRTSNGKKNKQRQKEQATAKRTSNSKKNKQQQKPMQVLRLRRRMTTKNYG
jgi:hypothetical protein